MKGGTTLRIASAELRLIFLTPVAWVMLTVYAVMCAVFFTDVYSALVSAQASRALNSVTDIVFSSEYLGLFNNVTSYIFLFIPLVTMGIVSRDISGGAGALLRSSPVSAWQVVAGKFLAMTGYAAAMLLIAGVFVLWGAFTIENMDWPLVLTGMLGLFLLICAYSAIGIFMSSLTSYPVVAALFTFAVLAALTFLKELWQNVPFVRDVTYWLSIDGRCEGFIRGMICSEDAVYFVAVTVFFLLLSAIHLSAGRMAGRRGWSLRRYAAATAALVAVAMVSQRPSMKFYYDATETRRLTLTEESRRVMKEIHGPAVMTTYVNMLDDNGFYLALPDKFNDAREYMEQYFRFKPDLKMKNVYYWTDIHSESVARHYPGLSPEQQAEELCDVYGVNFRRLLKPEEMAAEIDLSGEEYRIVSRIETADGKSTFLRFYDDSQRRPMEKEVTAAFKRLAEGAVPVGFVRGHGERSMTGGSDRDWQAFSTAKRFRHSLVNNGFDCTEVDLAEGIPAEVSVLVLADPRTALSEDELAELDRYIESGRNLLVAAEPGRKEVISPVLERLGVSCGTFSTDSLVAGEVYPEIGGGAFSEIREGGYKITMPGAFSFRPDSASSFSFEPVVASDSLMRYPVAARLSRNIGGRVQRAYLLGDADCFGTGELMKDRYAVSSANFSFIYEVFRCLSGGEYPVDTSRPSGTDNAIRMDSDSVPAMKWLLTGGFPLLLLLAGAVIVTRRRSR